MILSDLNNDKKRSIDICYNMNNKLRRFTLIASQNIRKGKGL